MQPANRIVQLNQILLITPMPIIAVAQLWRWIWIDDVVIHIWFADWIRPTLHNICKDVGPIQSANQIVLITPMPIAIGSAPLQMNLQWGCSDNPLVRRLYASILADWILPTLHHNKCKEGGWMQSANDRIVPSLVMTSMPVALGPTLQLNFKLTS